jgi:5-hydroxyisourate hydrolase
MVKTEDFLTVHVLDTATGRPAMGMSLALRRDGAARPLAERVTNVDGRCDTPLITGAEMVAGIYEITFDIAAWRAHADDAGFYDRITVRFRVPDQPGHLHIPLLLSPYGYSTYRGS